MNYAQNTLKSLLRVFLCVILPLLILSSCREDEPKLRIGVSQCSDDSWRRQLNREILREMFFHPDVEVEIRTAYDDNERQIADIERFIMEKVDALIVAPNEAEAITPVVEKAYDSGIPVILIDRNINSDKYTAYVGADNFLVGRMAGEYIADRLGGKGTVVEMTGLRASTPGQDRHNGFMEALKEYPGIRKVVVETDWTASDALARYADYLSGGGRADAVFAHNDMIASGVWRAEQSSGLQDKALLVGIDALNGEGLGVDMVYEGILNASFVYPTGGDVAAQVTMDILEGREYERETLLSTELVNTSNARIMRMQYSQIETLDEKIDTLNELLNSSMMEYSSQRKVLLLIIILLALVFILLMVAVYGFVKFYKMNGILEDQKRQIEEQREAKLAFFTNVSHDFRTPLTLISDPVEQLKKNGTMNENDRQLLDLVHKNVLVLRRLVNQILDFRKFESGKLGLHLSEFDISAAVKDWADSFSDLAWRKRISLNVRISPDCEGLKVVADMEKMERITYNLLSNAFKFTPEKGNVNVCISLSADGKSFVWVVEDSGAGISQEHINRIFDNFYQISDVHHSGSGIGLALVKAFVQLHSGEISVSSVSGQGTVFTMTIPLVQSGNISGDVRDGDGMDVMKNGAICDAVQQMGTDFYDEDYDVESVGECILVIDDNADVRAYIRSILKNEYRVIEAANGEEGLKKALKYVPDAVICDVMMPVMDGMECCRQLKDNVQTSHVPVMMLTAYTAENKKMEGYECGADSYMSKPFSSGLLKVRLRNLLTGRRRLSSIFGDSLPLSKEAIADADKGFVRSLRQIINNHIDDSLLSVETIGEKMCMSRMQLYRKTKALTGYSPNEYLRIMRLKKASAMLSSTEKTIAEVAYSVGFSSPSYFTKCYRDYYGESPTESHKRH